MSDKATLSDMKSRRQARRFGRLEMARSAAVRYDSQVIRAEPTRLEPPRPPAWARPDGSWRDVSEAEALYFAGAALASLNSVAKSDPPWVGA